ncbi:putative transcription factor WD40-like family [Helianthus anomalus]
MEDTVVRNNKRSSQHEILEVFNRQIGVNSPKKFSRTISASEALVKRIDLAGKLIGHEGCVNTIEFNYCGDHLVSGSDDRRVKFWNVATRSLVCSYASGHVDNIFQARIMPFTDDTKIITSAADGQVRLGQVGENGHVHTKKLGKHHGRVHKLAVEPGSPHIFYSCGEDGLVQHFDLRSNSSAKLFCCSSFSENNHHSSSNSLRLNSIVIDPRNPNYFSIGGSDQYARVYDIRKLQWDQPSSNQDRPVNTFCPKHLIKTHDVSITGMSYSHTSELLVSYNDELIYLFQKDTGLGPDPLSVSNENFEEPRMYSGHRNSMTVKGVSFFGPNSEYVMSGSDCGHIFIWNKKDCKLVRVMEGDRRIVNQVEPHPSIPVLASSGLEKNIKLWVPMSSDNTIPLPHDLQEIMESNKQGREDHSRVTLTPDVIMHVLRLHRRQAMAYIERRHNREDIASDEEDESDAYVLGFADHDGSLEDGNSSECSIV